MATQSDADDDAEPTIPYDVPPLPRAGGPDVGEIHRSTEVPYDDGETAQVNAVLTFDDAAGHTRTVRHMVVYDAAEQCVLEAEVGLIDDVRVYYRVFDNAEYVPSGLVHLSGIGETMEVKEYAELVGFDEPTWKVGPGFEEAVTDSPP